MCHHFPEAELVLASGGVEIMDKVLGILAPGDVGWWGTGNFGHFVS